MEDKPLTQLYRVGKLRERLQTLPNWTAEGRLGNAAS